MLKGYFSKKELMLLLGSLFLITASFLIFDRQNYLTLIASLIGAASLILGAKGNFVSQILMIIFSLIYGYISFDFGYYGEMLTYVGMTLPMSIFSLVSWLLNPHSKREVKVNKIKKAEMVAALFLSAVVTVIFYFILKHFNTENLFFSTLSVTTSFLAVYLTFRRSAFFALAYALNDVVLIVLWVFAAIENISYLSVIICFVVFLVNDLYGFINWIKMYNRQNQRAL